MQLKMRVYDMSYPYRNGIWDDIEFNVVKCSVNISSGSVKFRESADGIEYVYNISYLADMIITPAENTTVKLCADKYNSYNYPKMLYIDFRSEVVNFYYIPNDSSYPKDVIAALQVPDNEYSFTNINMNLDTVVFVLCADDRL